MYTSGISYFINVIQLHQKKKQFHHSQQQFSRNENNLNLADYEKCNFLLWEGEGDKA